MRNVTRRIGTAGALLLAVMMFTVSFTMVFGYTGASELQDTDAWTSDGLSELLSKQDVDVFVENGGQWDEQVKFAARTSFGHIVFGSDHILFDIRSNLMPDGSETDTIGHIVRMDLLDVNDVQPQGMEVLPYRTNIFHGNDPSRWGTDLLTCKQIIFEDLWDGIDLVYGSDNGRIKYEYRVGPGANHEKISFSFSGLEGLKVMDDSIHMKISENLELMDDGLFSYHRGSPDKEVRSGFETRRDGSIGYEIEGRDPARTLIIDPVIYGTYIGGSDGEYETDMDMDPDGACYLARSTWSFDFPTTVGAFNTRNAGVNDGFVMKILPDGSTPAYSTYVGGSEYDNIYSIAVDDKGAAYVGGCTESTNFPTTRGAFNETMNGQGQDIIVFKLNPSGSDLDYSTYIGGTDWENLNNMGCIAVDSAGCAHILGSSNSNDFPVTEDAFDKENNNTGGGWERDMIWRTSKVVLVKIKADGSDLEYSTYLGGTQDEYANGILLDDQGIVYAIGMTGSKDFPVTKGAFDTSLDSWSEIFVAKIDIVRSTILQATYLGGSFDQYASDLHLDGSGRLYICGWTGSFDFPVMEDAYSRELNGWMDIFVTAFDPTFSKLYMSTYIGGSEGEQAYSIEVDGDGNIMITGSTGSPDYPSIVKHADHEDNSDASVIVTVLDPLGKELLYSTLVGGSQAPRFPEDVGHNIFSTGERRVVISGYTGCTDFPITDNAYDNSMGGSADLFLMDFDLSLPPGVPRNLSIEQGDGYLNLTWDVPENDGGRPVLGYEIFRGLKEDELKRYNSTDGELYLNDTDLDMGKTYYYSVRAYNMVGSGLPSRIVSSQAACSPTPPQFFQVKRGNSWVKLTWEPPVFDGAYSLEGYRIYKNADGEEQGTIEVEITNLEYYDTEVENGVNYTYRVTTWNIIGESNPTVERWVIPQGEPSEPVGVSVHNGSGSVVLTWSEPEDDGGSTILFYRVYIGFTKGEDVVWRYVNSPGTEYTDTLVEIGKTYLYYVTAINSEGESIPSVEVEGTPQSEPSSPENVEVSEGNGYLIITWDAPSFLGGIELQGFKLYRSEGSNEALMLMEFNFDEMMYKDKEVTNGVTYAYTVTALNAVGESESSDEVQGTPAAVPGSPTGLTATAADGEVQLQWTAPTANGGAPVTDYIIFRKASSGDLEQIATVPVGTTSYTDTDVEASISYTYVVRSQNRMGSSEPSNEAQTVALGPPGAPTDISYLVGDGFVEISWAAPVSNGGSAISGYIVYRSDPELENLLIAAELGVDATSYRDEDVTNGESYIYTVNSANEIGESLPVWSGEMTPLGTPGCPVSLEISSDGTIISLTWTAPDYDGGCCIEIYRIYRVDEEGTSKQIGSVEGEQTSFVDDEDKNDGTYVYKVSSVNEIGESKTVAEQTVDVKGKDESSSFIADNIGLMVTLPIIVLLLVLLIIVMVRRKGSGETIEPVPQPAPVDQYQQDPNGYLDGYQEQAIGGYDNYDQLMPVENDLEQ
ncbi:MAG: fibronectin type III domain-containing protein [Thermoplasmatota archaeon]